MPNLPTLSVSDAQEVRILLAFGARYGTDTQAATIDAYKKWLEEAVVKTVFDFESERMQDEAQASLDMALVDLRADLPNPPPEPAPPSPEELARAERIALQMDGIDPNTPPQPLETFPPVTPTEETP